MKLYERILKVYRRNRGYAFSSVKQNDLKKARAAIADQYDLHDERTLFHLDELIYSELQKMAAK